MSLSIPDFEGLTADQIRVLLDSLDPVTLAELDEILLDVAVNDLHLLPHQIPPTGDWRMWVLLAGRGAGKTQACAHYMNEHAHGPACDPRVPGGHRMSIIAPTQGDAVDACVEGPSGLRALNPGIVIRGGVQGRYIRWPNGSTARLFGVSSPDDVERLRAGGNRCLVWMEELAAWRHLAAGMSQMRFGLRLGKNPRAIGSTTPKPRAEIRALIAEAAAGNRRTVLTTGVSTFDNPYLDADVREELRERYENTRLGRQELLGAMLEDGGDVIKPSWFKFVDQSPRAEDPRGWQTCRYWDLAATEGDEEQDEMQRSRAREEGNDPDWTAGALVSWNPTLRHLVIEDMQHVRRTPGDVQALVVQTAASDGRGVAVRVEQEPGSGGVITVNHYKANVLPTYSCQGHRPTGSKVTRAEAWSGLAEQGKVFVVAGTWTQAWLDECEEFSRDDTHAHDDMIDAVSGAYDVLVSGGIGRGGLRA